MRRDNTSFQGRIGGDTMATRKDLIIAVLATFCLTTTLFMIIPTRSSPTTSQLGVYDPWVDIDGDGQITIYDVVGVTKSYGATGDPTKNVNVTNFPQEYEVQVLRNYNFSWDGYGMYFGWTVGAISVGKYSRMSVMLVPTEWINATFNLDVDLTFVTWAMGDSGPYGTGAMMSDNQQNTYYSISIGFDPYPPLYIPYMQTNKFTVIETKAPSVILSFDYGTFDVEHGWVMFDIYVYLRRE
jgi:hypothetical protein